MKNFGLYVILTCPVVPHERIAESCVRHGVKMMQLREKNMNDRELLQLALRLKSITSGSRTKLIINDRMDIALFCAADGTHFGQDDVPVSNAQFLLQGKTGHCLGLSTHSLVQVMDSAVMPADYIGFGPVFPTFAKKNPDPVTGTDQLKKAVELAKVPVVAIGGINRENINQVIAAGAKNVAMIKSVCRSKNYDAEIRYFKEKLEEL